MEKIEEKKEEWLSTATAHVRAMESLIWQRVERNAAEVNKLSCCFSALISFMLRKMSEKDALWAMKWIYEILEIIDYEYRNKETEMAIFEELYGVNWEDLWMNGDDVGVKLARELERPYTRAINTLGEVKLLSNSRANDFQSYSSEIEEVLKAIQKLKEGE